jgi:hypothetical protein
MEVQYQIVIEKKLLIQKYTGNFSIKHFANHVKKIIKNPRCKYIRKILSDFREVNLEISQKRKNKIIQIRKKILKKDVLHVFLVDKPFNTFAIHLYTEELKDKYNNKYCSTLDYALKLLKLSENKDEIEKILNSLECFIK